MAKQLTRAALDLRRSEAMALKLSGHSLRKIAEYLYISHETVRNDIHVGLSKAREDWNADTAHFKTLTLDRLNELFKKAWPISLSDTPAADAAFYQVMKIMELECEIHGLIAPRVQGDNDAR